MEAEEVAMTSFVRPAWRPPSARVAPGPVVGERIAPAPVVRERIAPAGSAYAVGSRVADAYALAPMPQAVVSSVPATRSYRYMVINNRLLLVDPATDLVVA